MNRTRLRKTEDESTNRSGARSRGDSRRLAADDVFEVLSNARRRYAFHYLKHRGRDQIGLRRVAEQVAARENDTSVDALTAAERKRVQTALRQFHLPKMHDRGFVEYDAQRGTVTLSEAASNLDIYLDVVSKRNVPWGLYYVGVSLINATLLAAVWLGLFPFSLLPDRLWTAYFVASVAISAVVHSYYNSKMRIGVADAPPETDAP